MVPNRASVSLTVGPKRISSYQVHVSSLTNNVFFSLSIPSLNCPYVAVMIGLISVKQRLAWVGLVIV